LTRRHGIPHEEITDAMLRVVPGALDPGEGLATDTVRRFCRERWTNPTTIERNQYIPRRLVADGGQQGVQAAAHRPRPPHDLRRSAAGILHRDRGPDGAHRSDLLDVQKVLHHADPVTTMKCYLDPMDTEVLDRAADVLD
jgi:integrase